MKSINSLLFFPILLLLLAPAVAPAQLTPAAAVAAMGRGINMGNTLEPPNEGDWNDNVAREELFDFYRDAGFTNVRIPVRWDNHTGQSAPYTVDPAWMNRVEQVVDWALERGLYVTLNTHHEDWIKTTYSQASRRARFEAIWRQIIARFKDKSDRLLYEPINEPKGMSLAEINLLNQRTLDIIRAEEPTRLVIISGNQYSNIPELLAITIPDDDYLIGYFHSYDPWPFAGQGNGTWGTPADVATVFRRFAQVKNWSNRTGLPVHLSEFGTVVRGDFNSRMRFMATYVEAAVQNGFAFSAWDDGGMFQILERSSGEWPAVKDILINARPSGPTTLRAASVGPEAAPAVAVTWVRRDESDAAFVVERGDARGTAFTAVATLTAGATSYTDENVTLGRTYTYRVSKETADGTLLQSYPQRVTVEANTAPVQAPFENRAMTIPGALEVERYDAGGQDLAYSDNEPANLGGAGRQNEGVDVGFGPGGSQHVGYIVQGEWLEYTVTVEESGAYELSGNFASLPGGGGFRVSAGGASAVEFAIPSTGGWATWRTFEGSGLLELAAGTQIIRIDITGSGPFNMDRIDFALSATSVEDVAAEAGFLAAPNPASDRLTVSVPARLAGGSGQLSLFALSGARLANLRVTAGERRELSLEDYPAGTYLLRLTDGERSLLRRIVKQ